MPALWGLAGGFFLFVTVYCILLVQYGIYSTFTLLEVRLTLETVMLFHVISQPRTDEQVYYWFLLAKSLSRQMGLEDKIF